MRIILGAGEGPTSCAYRRRVVAVASVALLAVMLGILAQFSQATSAPAGVSPAGVTPAETPRTDPGGDVSRDRRALPAGWAGPRSGPGVSDMALGRADAPVVLVEYADFRCGYCTRFARDTAPEIVRRYVDTGVVRFEFRNFPVRGDDSVTLARAAWAAGLQGRFWAFHDVVFVTSTVPRAEGAGAPADNTPRELAAAAGVPDLDRFAADLASDAAREAVDRDLADGVAAGAEMTPTFYVNGKQLVGALPNETFFAEIEEARKSGGYGRLLGSRPRTS